MNRVVDIDRIELKILFSTLLFCVGFTLVLVYGQIGFLPSNQSIIFDGGWRIYSGQIPFKDFAMPNALVPSVLQSIVFSISGVSWFSYVLHSALVNGMFAVLVFLFLRSYKLSVWRALLFGVASAIVFYVPSGLPYMEQHSFFFLLAALVSARYASTSKLPTASMIWSALVIPLLLLSYLSKQIPSLLFAPIIVCYFYYSTKHIHGLVVRATGYSVCVILITLYLVYMVFEIDVAFFYEYFIELPSSLGAERLIAIFFRKQVQNALQMYGIYVGIICILIVIYCSRLMKKRGGFGNLSLTVLLVTQFVLAISTFYVTKMLSTAFLPIVCFFYFFYYFKHRSQGHAQPWLYDSLKEILVAMSFIIATLLFIGFTNMVPENGIPFLIISAGLICVTIERVIDSKPGWINRTVLSWVLHALIIIVVVDVVVFHARVNMTRAALSFSKDEFKYQEEVDPTLNSLQWMKGPVYRGYNYRVKDLSELIQYLIAKNKNFWFFGDASIVYGLTGKPSINPSLWFHYGLTIPNPHTAAFNNYESRLLNNFKQYDIRYIVLEDDSTKMGCKLSDHLMVSKFIQQNGVDTTIVSGFRVIALR